MTTDPLVKCPDCNWNGCKRCDNWGYMHASQLAANKKSATPLVESGAQ